MNPKEKYLDLLAKSRAMLTAATEAVGDGDIETAKASQAKAAEFAEQAEVIKAALDLNAKLDTLDTKEEPVAELVTQTQEPVKTDEPSAVKANRMDFETDDEPATTEEDAEESFQKSVYALKYGSMDAALNVVVKDLYGADYFARRERQMNAFTKYIRVGESRLSSKESQSLQDIVLLPETIKNEILMDASVSDIKSMTKATLVEALGDLGGYLVPEDYRAEVIKRLMGLTFVRGRARVISTLRDAVEWPKLEGGNSLYTSAVRVTWVDETPASASVAETNPTWGMLRVPVHTVMARTDLSRNLVEDAAFNLLDVLADLFAEAMAIDEDARFLTGVGGGTPKGVLGNRSGANQVPDDGVLAVNSGNATALTADGLIDLVYGIHAQYRANAAIVGARLSHRDIRKIKDGNGDYLWAKGLAPGEPPTLLSYPFFESENMPVIGANNYPLIFGDFKGYLVADRVGMSIERVVDTTTVGTNKVALFARRRLGGQVIEPWRFQAQKVSA